jgi:glycosyltransferase involved in cell wall biosynthesis
VNEPLKTTLLLPTLNEIEAVRAIVPQIRKEWVDEIICIDGGSTDGTVEFMREHGIRVHSQSGRGFGQGMLQGMHLATGDIVVEFTPDGNAIPADIPRMIDKVREGYDLVVASRYLPPAKSYDDDWLTATGNWLFTRIVNVMFGTRYTDVLIGFRAYRRAAALPLGLDTPGLSWPCQGSIRFARAGLRIIEIPADEPARIGGARKMKPIKTGLEIWRVILREFFRSPGSKSAGAERQKARE